MHCPYCPGQVLGAITGFSWLPWVSFETCAQEVCGVNSCGCWPQFCAPLTGPCCQISWYLLIFWNSDPSSLSLSISEPSNSPRYASTTKNCLYVGCTSPYLCPSVTRPGALNRCSRGASRKGPCTVPPAAMGPAPPHYRQRSIYFVNYEHL